MTKADKIRGVIEDVVDDADVQAGYPDANGNTNVTWCNRALNRMLVMLGGKAGAVLDPAGINWTNANRMVLNARLNLSPRVAGNGKLAQERADNGELIIAVRFNDKGSGHVALVCPNPGEEFNPMRGPLIGQAGKKCGIMYVAQGFGTADVEYYHVPYENGGMGA